MKIGIISKMFVVLAVLLVSIMSVSAVDLSVGPTKLTDSDGATTLYVDANPVCTFKLYTTNSDVEDNLDDMDVKVDWYQNGDLTDFVAVDAQDLVFSEDIDVSMPNPSLEVGDTIKCEITATLEVGEDTFTDSDDKTKTIGNYDPVLDLSNVDVQNIDEDSEEGEIFLAFGIDTEDGFDLSYSIASENTAKVDCAVTTDGSEFTFKPAADYFNTNSNDACCTVKVTDSNSGSDEDDVCFKVTNDGADSITFTSSASGSATVDVEYSYAVTVSNPDELTLNVDVSPAWLSVKDKTKTGFTVSGTPNLAISENVVITVTAGDQEIKQEYSLGVSNPSEPSISSKTTGVEFSTSFTYNLNSMLANPSNVPVTFEVTNKPNTMTVSSEGTNTNNKLTWVPTETDKGDHTINVKATYMISGQQKETVSVTLKVRVKGPSCLAIKDIDADVGPNSDDLDSDSGADKDGGDVEAQPGDIVVLSIEVENICEEEDDNDHEVEEIEVTAVLEEIKDEDEQDFDETYKDLDVDEDDTQDFTFEVPDDADKGTYTITIDVVGYDKESGDLYETDQVTVDVIVDKESHKLKFNTFSLNPSTVSCTFNTQLAVKLVNIGDNDEDDIELVISNSELNIEEIELIDRLEEGDSDDDDTYFKKTYNLQIPSDANLGSYVLTGKVYYDDGDEDEAISAILNVVGCGGSSTATGTTVDLDDEQEETVEVITTAAPITSTSQTATATTDSTDDEVEQDSFFDSGVYVGFLIAAIVIVLLVIVGLVVAIGRK
ncbi:hypothetical protein HOC35_05525 [Candidatus Woesearchaeota archaeon]|nr:hypothetical protein [Candidatus Woesearchaeota archaeon]